MRILMVAALVALAFTTAGCSRSGRNAAPVATPTPDSLVSKRGISMPFEKAVRGISFRPFVPALQLVDVALIAPLTGADVRANRGIAFEYAANGQALALSEWPLHNVHLSVGAGELGATPCVITAYKADGVIWTTPHRVVMTLQPDGNIKPPRIFAEARRLLSRGACL